MDKDEARRLGQHLRNAREGLKLSSRGLAARTGLTDATIVRIELGEFAAPSPDKLARMANALGLPLEDVYALADYAAPRQLPNLSPYLRTKYRDLPDEAAEQIENYAQRLAKKHGVNLRGPAPGEDEEPDTITPNRASKPRTKTASSPRTTKPNTKGGTK